jgi:cytoskeletal protein CcmA (bactofilin family)
LLAAIALAGGLVATPAAAAAASGVPPGQTHHGTLTVRDQAGSIQGTVDGNVSVQDHATVTVTGHVTGWLHVYGQSTVTIGDHGRVDGGVLQSTGMLTVEPGAEVGKDLDTFNLSGQPVLGGQVAGGARVSASGFEISRQGRISGDLWVWASAKQQVEIDGIVDGSVHVSGTDLHLGRGSHIGGSTKVYSGQVVNG